MMDWHFNRAHLCWLTAACIRISRLWFLGY